MPIEHFYNDLSSYHGMSEMIKNYTCAELAMHIATELNVSVDVLLNYPMGSYSKGKNNGAYQDVLEDLKRNISRYDAVYQLLSDETSQNVFTHLFRFRLVPDNRFIKAAVALNGQYSKYFDKDILTCTKEDVFVDCGAFIGDTVLEYFQQYEEYKHIYVYEPSKENMEACRSNLRNYSNITFCDCGVGETNSTLSFSQAGEFSGFVGTISEDFTAPVVSLDQEIKEPITYIKINTNGFEIPTILGAKNHIKNDVPKLSICASYIISDLWELPLLIHTITPDYKFYFRHYGSDRNGETILYAIPKVSRKTVVISKKPKTAVAFPGEPGWRNVELTKDCGLIPYLLYKNHHLDVTMTGTWVEPYPYLDTYVKGMKMEFIKNGDIPERKQYITQYAKNIDCLIIRGCYNTNFDLVILYKQLNPNGKVYVGLDANSYWMDFLPWDDPVFMQFMNSCDVIATSCRAMQKHLNEKWPWKIEYIPNGYYSFGEKRTAPKFSQKENSILTVSRLGSPEKATDLLLNAFAQIADRIPDWKLKLVGGIEESFHTFIEKYFQKYPQLVSRIEFTGVISDKDKLFEEYQKAKIFALPSVSEGGPNVISEALTAGCVIAVTKIDIWEDAIDEGRCGMAVDINDMEGFSAILLELCHSSQLPQMSEYAYQYALRNYDMEDIVAKLYEMLFGGELE